MEQCHAKYHIVVGNIGNYKVDRVAPLCPSPFSYAYRSAYDSGSAHGFAVNRGDWLQLQFRRPLRRELISHGLRNEVI